MRTLREKHIGTLELVEPYDVLSLVEGGITVKAGGVLKLYGTCTKSVVVEQGVKLRFLARSPAVLQTMEEP